MKGKILNFNIQESTGIITGNDEKRYNFTTAEWKSDTHPAAGQVVDFEADGENAKGIYLEDVAAAAPTHTDEKSKIVAALLAFFLGGLGIHKFYLGCTTAGAIMLVLFLGGFILLGIPSLVIGIISFIEFIIYLTKSDADFHRIYVVNKKCWF